MLARIVCVVVNKTTAIQLSKTSRHSWAQLNLDLNLNLNSMAAESAGNCTRTLSLHQHLYCLVISLKGYVFEYFNFRFLTNFVYKRFARLECCCVSCVSSFYFPTQTTFIVLILVSSCHFTCKIQSASSSVC